MSHEFRTPLTLMLGSLEELSARGTSRDPEERQQLDVARRNALRLLKLVNTLLDFSRIEAGRVQAVYEPTDLRTLTAEIASSFRSAMEKAGLRFLVNCEPIEEPIYVDRDMWEKIVLNLLSNAFKFTFAGEVHVSLRPVNHSVELSVRDTGVGIEKQEQPRIFERFHRVESAHARTYEGTGIGLALVQELVKLHGGEVHVESELGRGSTFTVIIPRGASHLPAKQIGAGRTLASTALSPDAYRHEAERWLPEGAVATDAEDTVPLPSSAVTPTLTAPEREHIVVADDNADMRDYLAHLLSKHYTVHAVADGSQALEAVRQLNPILVVADVMMPMLDGFGLVHAIRSDPSLCSTPVILLSARAGEESRVEGLQGGADDYLVKPFTARELIARVTTHVKMARLRRDAAQRESRLRAEDERERRRLEELLAQAPAAIALLTGSDHRWIYVNENYIRLTGRSSAADFLGKTLVESLPELETQVFVGLLNEVYRTGKPYFGREMMAILNRSASGLPDESYWDFVYQPVRDVDGIVEGILVHAVEVTDKVAARNAVKENAERLLLAQTAAQIGTWEWDPERDSPHLSSELHHLFGTAAE
ncbi:MAG TPA: ATP-binding protein, partial [Acidobacteriaceae bacterium]|nr:ATP-binding protein [Acidobacteriaceae bacterium]